MLFEHVELHHFGHSFNKDSFLNVAVSFLIQNSFNLVYEMTKFSLLQKTLPSKVILQLT